MARKKNPKKKDVVPPFNFSMAYIIILIGSLLIWFLSSGSGSIEIGWKKFSKDMLLTNDVEKLDVVNNSIVEIYIKPSSLNKKKFKDIPVNLLTGKKKTGPQYHFSIGSVEVFHDQMKEAQASLPNNQQVEIRYSTRVDWWGGILSWLLPIGLMILLWAFISRRINSGIQGGQSVFNFGRSNARVREKGEKSTITFADVAGLEEAKSEIYELVKFLRTPEKFERLGAKIPKGILLVGPPGSGKTLLAKAVAGEANVPFFSLSGSEFVEMFVGVGAARMRDLFRQAKEKAPSIIFIDEIDTVGRARGRSQIFQPNEERESTLNQLLAELDGFDSNTGVIVLAATNRGDILDPALLRPGRFDRHVHLELPTVKEREAIFLVHMKPLVLSKNVSAAELAVQTPGFSGADISNICNEAALIASRADKNAVESKDFSDAIDRVIGGLERKSKILSDEEKKRIAYHESGHAITGWFLENPSEVNKISIIPRGRSLGSTWFLPEEHQIITESHFLDSICMALGGRAAEKIILNEISSNALDDLEKATKQAYTMVVNYGFSPKLSNVSYYDSTGALEQSFQKPFSEKTGEKIDEEVQRIIDEAYTKALKILEDHRTELDILAKALIEKELLHPEDIKAILGERKKLKKI